MKNIIKIAMISMSVLIAQSMSASAVEDGGISKAMARSCKSLIKETYGGVFQSQYTYFRAYPKSSGPNWTVLIHLKVTKAWNDDESLTLLKYYSYCTVDPISFKAIDFTTPRLIEPPK